jgi:asparagine synthase (glutamine-hydrolysing)
MCGIAGLIDTSLAGNAEQLTKRARAMADAIAHRGPDGWNTWTDPDAGLAFAHRRLAVIDVTPTGAQPMNSADGRWVITYNGEIYNAAEIACTPELAGFAFRGTSDTEVILESVAARGLDRTLADLNGMFAFALWDRKTRTLYLVCDRLGIKPLFYTVKGGAVRFASELKALAAVAPLGSIDPSSIASFFRFGYVPAPYTIFAGICKLMPGEIASIDGARRTGLRTYWSLTDVVGKVQPCLHELPDAEAEPQLHELLADAVARQMVSDVPLGAFLSGGIDSSIVVSLMVAAAKGTVRTFSIGFPELGFDESRHAAAVARHLGADHEELIVTAAEALAIIPRLPDMYDEPFADSSQIPTSLVSTLTRRRVTVALSGDGGDELFGGYDRYAFAEKILRLPSAARGTVAAVINAIPDGALDVLANLLPGRIRPAQPADKLRKLAELLPYDPHHLYLRLVSHCSQPVTLANNAPEQPLGWERYEAISASGHLLEWMQVLDAVTYLPNDILQKVDRASMACGLEVRPPLLDHRVVAFAFALPRRFRVRNGERKWLLRRVLERYVPRSMFDRPKMGFGVPLADWLHGPLREWAEDLLEPSRLGGGYVNVAAARGMWADHITGKRNRANALWTVLMFEAWRRRWATIQ